MNVETKGNECDEGSEEQASRSDVLEEMQSMIPDSAVQLGDIQDEVDNWTSWETDDHFYVIPWPDSNFDWALFRISWDDNWGRYEWECCARISGAKEPLEAARIMVKRLFKKWGIDLRTKENAAYRNFLAGL